MSDTEKPVRKRRGPTGPPKRPRDERFDRIVLLSYVQLRVTPDAPIGTKELIGRAFGYSSSFYAERLKDICWLRDAGLVTAIAPFGKDRDDVSNLLVGPGVLTETEPFKQVAMAYESAKQATGDGDADGQ